MAEEAPEVACAAVLRAADPSAFLSCSSIFEADKAKAVVVSTKPLCSYAIDYGVTSR